MGVSGEDISYKRDKRGMGESIQKVDMSLFKKFALLSSPSTN
jgi:hypothetical protein